MADFDAIIGKQYYQCNQALIDRLLPRLKYVITCGAGLDNIDLKYCAEKGIKVFNAPGSNAASVAGLEWKPSGSFITDMAISLMSSESFRSRPPCGP